MRQIAKTISPGAERDFLDLKAAQLDREASELEVYAATIVGRK